MRSFEFAAISANLDIADVVCMPDCGARVGDWHWGCLAGRDCLPNRRHCLPNWIFSVAPRKADRSVKKVRHNYRVFIGLTDALVNYVPEQIAKTLLADPPGAGTGLTGLLDPSTLLSGLNLGDLGGLLDPSTLAGDLTTLLPSLASDLPAGLADLGTLIPF
jgi:hypothetical protein